MTRASRTRTAPPDTSPRRRGRLTAVATVLALGAAGLAAAPGAQAATSYVSDPVQYVNPFIGTQDEGNTYPGATVPFGMVQLSPDTGHNTGYDYTQSAVRGFSTTHMSGVGCGLDGFVPILPTTSKPSSTDYGNNGYARSFKKSGGDKVESAEPGYYTATLTSGTNVDIKAELTATEHTGLQRYTFPVGQDADVLINAGQSLSSVSQSSVKVVGDDTVITTSTVHGFCQDTEPFTVYSVTTFSRPFASAQTWVDNTYSNATEASSSKRTGAILSFDTSGSNSKVVEFQTAISYVDVAGAEANLAAEATTFDQARTAAHQTWEDQLSKVQVSDDTDTTQLRTFYSALYRSFLAPNTGTDVDGRYRGWDGDIHDVAADGLTTYYQNFSLWDTYRTQQQILALLEPQRSKDMAFSVVLEGEQGGWAPRWGYGPVETNIMTGDPVTPFLVSAYHEGLLTPDQAERAYAVLKQNADGVPPADSPSNGRMGNPSYIKDGYVPLDHGAAHKPGDFDLDHGGSATLEYALADATLSTLAADLGHTADAQRYAERGQNFRAIWDSTNQTFRSRTSDGLFVPETDPSQIDGFHEGTALQYQWLVQQDIPGLIDLMGGKAATNQRLDDFFAYADVLDDPADAARNSWVSGAYSYYGTTTYNPNNEPDLHSPFIYLWTGQPWKTSDIVRAALTLFTDGPTGVTGNDDLGEMSSWDVASSLGIFPIMPGKDVWGLSTPVFDSVRLTLDTSFYTQSSGTLTINAPGVSDSDHYVQSLSVDGQDVDRAYLSGTELVDASTIDYTVGSNPSSWATADSASPGTIATAPAPTHVYVSDGKQIAVEPGDTITGATSIVVQGPGTTDVDVSVSGSDKISYTGPASVTASTDGGSVQVPLDLSVAGDIPDGLYPVTVTASTSDGDSGSGTVVFAVGQDSWLASVTSNGFNNKAIGDAQAGSANFANNEFFIRSAMAPGGIGAGVVHTVPGDPSLTYVLHDEGAGSPPTAYDNLTTQGQTTDVQAGLAGATKIAFVGSVNNGPVDPQTVTLRYTDGTEQQLTGFGFTDWCSGSPQVDGNVVVGKAAQRWSGGGVQDLACGLWATKTYDLEPGKTVKTITWPNAPKEHVFAIARDTPPTTAPSVTGSAVVGSTLTAVPGTYPEDDYAESYQWLADGQPIADATGAQLALTPALVGASVSLRVTAQRPGLQSVIVSTTQPLVVAPDSFTVSKAPTVRGSAKPGQVLTVVPGTYSVDGVSEAYQWLLDGKPVAGATGSSFAVSQSAVGHRVAVSVTASKAGFSDVVTVTEPVGPVAPSAITVVSAPKVKGKARVGKRLHASAGSFSVAGVQVSYRWFRGHHEITGKKGAKASYKVRAKDKGKRLHVQVTASKAGYTPVSVSSKSTAKVKKGKIKVKKKAKIKAAKKHAKVGKKLKVTKGKYKPKKVKVTYRWFSGHHKIKGKKGKKRVYRVRKADAGKKLRVKVKVKKKGYKKLTYKTKKTPKVKG